MPAARLAVGALSAQAAWRAFAAEFGALFQLVDDLVDDDGIVREQGRPTTEALAQEAEQRARARLREIDADDETLEELLDELGARAQQSSV